jgi:hypothetical protein
MGDSGMDRAVLNAALNNISQKQNLEKNVADAKGVLMKLSDLAERNVQYFVDRPESEILIETLKYNDLEFVGKRKCVREKRGNIYRLTFVGQEPFVEFVFRKKGLRELAGESCNLFEEESRGGENLEKVLDLIEAKKSDVLLGKHSRTLGIYSLGEVYLISKSPVVVFNYKLPICISRRQIVYPIKD